MVHISQTQFFRGVEDCIPETAKESLCNPQKPLLIKFGADPSAPDLHLGHTVVLRKLRQLQNLGHKVVFLIGDFTAMIGDPTGKSETRKPISADQIVLNAKTYQEQVFKILDREKTQVVFNSTWLNTLTPQQFITLSSQYTVSRMLERDDFHKRFQAQKPISIHEFLYPLLQGYDSVALKADVEIGGTDQKFNLLMGRTLQKEYGQTPQTVLTVSILEGLDGVQKMSKSLGNHIGILDAPNDMFGKVMSIPDTLIIRYFELLTDKDEASIKAYQAHLAEGKNPRDIKVELGLTLVEQFHSPEAAQEAKNEFERIFSQKGVPTEMETLTISSVPKRLADIVLEKDILPSKKEFTRLIEQKAISLDGAVLTDSFIQFCAGVSEGALSVNEGQVLKIGKRRFFKVSIGESNG